MREPGLRRHGDGHGQRARRAAQVAERVGGVEIEPARHRDGRGRRELVVRRVEAVAREELNELPLRPGVVRLEGVVVVRAARRPREQRREALRDRVVGRGDVEPRDRHVAACERLARLLRALHAADQCLVEPGQGLSAAECAHD